MMAKLFICRKQDFSAASMNAVSIQTYAAAEEKFNTVYDSHSTLGMGQRYVISVTKNEAKNEAGCYQNRIASHFNRSACTSSCNLVNLKIT